jgi:DNA polymerase-1
MKYKVILVDGRHLLFRCADAMRELGVTDADGFTNTGAIFGFLKSTLRMYDRYAEDGAKLVVCWEGGRLYRRDIFDGYKRKEDTMTEELQSFLDVMMEQEKWLRAMLKFAGWHQAVSPGYEADDVLGTLAKSFSLDGQGPVAIYTGDMDLHQCVTDDVSVISPPRPGKPGESVWTRAEVEERWAVPPERVPEYKGLAGDKSDRIPGVRGVGDVWAKKLLNAYVSLEELLKAAKTGEVSGEWSGKAWKSKTIAKAIVDDEEMMFISRRLATIVDDVPVAWMDRLHQPDRLRKAMSAFQILSLMGSIPFGKIIAIGNT